MRGSIEMQPSTLAQFDRVEQQFKQAAAYLASGDALQLQTASANLHALSAELARLVQASPPNKILSQRVKILAQGLQMLRDNLSRQAAFNQQSLQVLLPQAAKSTYSGGAKRYS